MSGTPFSNVNKQSMVPEDQKNMTTHIVVGRNNALPCPKARNTAAFYVLWPHKVG